MKIMNIGVVAVAIILAGCSTLGTPAESLSASGGQPEAFTPHSPDKSFVVPEGGATSSILSCPSKRVDYIPIPALPAGGCTDVSIDPRTKKSVATHKNWPADAGKVNELLTNIATNISLSTQELSGSVGGGLFSGSRSEKQYVIDFMKWRAEPLSTSDDKQLGWVRVGAGGAAGR